MIKCSDCKKELGSNPVSCHECAMHASAKLEEQESAQAVQRCAGRENCEECGPKVSCNIPCAHKPDVHDCETCRKHIVFECRPICEKCAVAETSCQCPSRKVCRTSWCGRPISDDNKDGYCCDPCRTNHPVAMAGPADDLEEKMLYEDNTSSIIANDIACECGTHNPCPMHNEL